MAPSALSAHFFSLFGSQCHGAQNRSCQPWSLSECLFPNQTGSDYPCVSFSTAVCLGSCTCEVLEKICTPSFYHLCHSTVCRSAPSALLLLRKKALHLHTTPADNEPTLHAAPGRVPRHLCRALSSMGNLICAKTLVRCSGSCWDHPL